MFPNNSIWLFPYGHHYVGGGGCVPTSRDIEDYLDILDPFNVKGTFFFDGILINELKKENSAVFKRINAMELSVGYHGEETHGPYPVIIDYLYGGVNDSDNLLFDLTWDDAVKAVETRYSHEIVYSPPDPQSRMLDLRMGGESNFENSGGISLVQETFGRSVDIVVSHGLEAAPSGYAFTQLSDFQVVQAAPPVVPHYLTIVGKQALEEEALSLGGDDKIFFWFMNQLHTKEFRDDEMPDELSKSSLEAWMRRLSEDQSRPHLVNILMHGRPGQIKKNFYEKMNYLVNNVVPSLEGCQFVTPQDMLAQVERQNENPITFSVISEIADRLDKLWQHRPPNWVHLDGLDFSLTEAFEGLLNFIVHYADHQCFPNQYLNRNIFGPIGEPLKFHKFDPVKISIDDLQVTLKEISQSIYLSEPPCLPVSISIDDMQLNTAEVLNAMTQLFLSICRGQQRTTLIIEPSEITPPYADVMDKIFNPSVLRPLWYSKLQLWTVKPAKTRVPIR